MKNRTVPVWLAGVLLLGLVSCAVEEPEGASAVAPFAPPASVPGLVPVAQGWAQTSINAVIFRKNALVTHQDTQYVALDIERMSEGFRFHDYESGGVVSSGMDPPVLLKCLPVYVKTL